MKKLIKIILLTLLCVIIFTGCNNAKPNQTKTINIKEFDLLDINEMNIGAEMPDIIYSDDNKAILTGTFGVLEYSFESKEIINRLSSDKLTELGVNLLNAQVSSNGNIVYLQYTNPSDGAIDDIYYTYDTQAKDMEKHSGKPKDDMYKRSIINESAGYSDNFDKYLDLNYLIGRLNNYKGNEGILYTRAEQDWCMQHLEIVIYNYATKTNKIYGVFNGEFEEKIVKIKQTKLKLFNDDMVANLDGYKSFEHTITRYSRSTEKLKLISLAKCQIIGQKMNIVVMVVLFQV